MCLHCDGGLYKQQMDTHVTHFHFTDASALLCDEQSKKPCRKFLQKGSRTVEPFMYPITGNYNAFYNDLCFFLSFFFFKEYVILARTAGSLTCLKQICLT